MRKDKNANVSTLEEAVEAMRDKIKQQIPVYRNADLAQEATNGNGETVLKQNPLVQEFRATVRDYSASLKALKEIKAEQPKDTEITSLSTLKDKFKIAK